MILRRWRSTLRTLILPVIACGLASGAAVWTGRAERFRHKAAVNKALARIWRRNSETDSRGTGGERANRAPLRAGEEAGRIAEHHEALAETYEGAARRPWRIVPPDGPEPE